MAKMTAARVAAGNPIIRVYIEDTDGLALPDLAFGTSGLLIQYQRELVATASSFSGSNLETITTIGTYAAPTSGKARFKEMSSTTMQGWYEIHLPQAAVGTGDASRTLQGMVSGVTGMRDCPFEIELVPDAIPNDSTQLARVTDVTTVGTDVTTLLSRLSSARAGYLDNLSAGAVAQASALSTVAGYLDTEIAAILAAVDTEVAAILSLLDDARTEPGQGAPPVNPDMATKIDYLYKAWRNKKEQTATLFTLYADNGSTADQKSVTSDDGTTFTAGEMITGA